MTQSGAVFQLPTQAQTYVDDIRTRCHDLIERQIWRGLHISDLRRWMANFVTDEEKYFAACVLDSLIYRSENQTIALIKQLYQRILPDLSRQTNPPAGKNIDWQDALNGKNTNDPKIRLIPVKKRDDSPAKSAHLVLRLMKRNLGIGERWMVTDASEVPDCISKGVETFIFIDDFLGTGTQFEEFFRAEQLDVYQSRAYMAYLPLAGHETGISHLNKIFPALHVKPVETLDKSHCLFNSESQCFKDGINSPETAKNFYYELLKRKQIEIAAPHRRGYGCLELAYFFSHAAPDNCLPILWWNKSTSWKPLFNR